MNASYINMYLEEKSVHVVKHQKSYFLSISCKYFYTRIFRTHILYTLTTAASPPLCHAHNDRKRFVPNKILEGKPIPRSFHSFALEMKLFDSPFFCLSTLWSNSEWAITISPGFFFPSPFNFCFDLAEQQALYKSRWKKLTYRTMML